MQAFQVQTNSPNSSSDYWKEAGASQALTEYSLNILQWSFLIFKSWFPSKIKFTHPHYPMRIPKLVSSINCLISMKSAATCNRKSMFLSTSTICAYSSWTISPILEDRKGGVIVCTWYNHLNCKKVLKGFTSWITNQVITHNKLTWLNLTIFANMGKLINTSGFSCLFLCRCHFHYHYNPHLHWCQ